MSVNRILLLFVLVLGSTCAATAQSQEAIGKWRDHFPYRNMVAVAEGGGNFYCATATGLFRYTPGSGEIQRLNKVNALNDVGIQGLAWNETLGMLLVYYTNGNLDLIQGESSYNMGDIKRSSLLGNKGIYSVYFEGPIAFLGCGFGIVKVDLARREVRETWFIGPSGAQVQVNGITVFQDSIYAATTTGLFVAKRTAANLASFDNWHKRADMGVGMADGPFSAAVRFGDRLLVNYKGTTGGDTLLTMEGSNTWGRFSPLFGYANNNLNVSADGAYLVIPHEYDVQLYDLSLTMLNSIYGYLGTFANPTQAIRGSDTYFWVADRNQGLVRSPGGDQGTGVRPSGPSTANTWRMASSGGAVYVATGALAGNWTNSFLKDGIHYFQQGEWRTIDRSTSPLMDHGANTFGGTVNDVVAVIVDPDDAAHAFVGSWEEGLIEVVNGQPVTIYNADNSSLQIEINATEGKVLVAGLDYDRDNNLWMTNPNTNSPIAVRTKAGDWHSYSPGNLLNGNNLVSDIVAASNGYKWIVRPRGNGLLVFDDGGTVGETGDDQYKVLNNIVGTGGLPAPDVFCVAEDEDGQMWVGTSKGIAVFYTPSAIFESEDYDAQQILIEQDGNVQILLETEYVSAIAIDGANRKWIGTQTGGVYLVSADGREQIHHFTAANSPLPSDNITAIAIEGTSGEVYLATDRGIMSYRSDATEGADENTCATVFPNPVHETYTGPIAISGLVRDSEVKITDVSGNLVYRTTSLGGQAIWTGNDMSGNRVSTGVYLILATDRYGTFKCNTKVLVAR
ncbi:MAG: two-component regulator propeller domain-containing protein [Flavobacteriales bacterium]